MIPVARVGDTSDHGGVVISSPQSNSSDQGHNIAVIGALHDCPRRWPGGSPHGITAFSSGSGVSHTYGIAWVRFFMDPCGCGAVVVSGNPVCFVTDGSMPIPASSMSLAFLVPSSAALAAGPVGADDESTLMGTIGVM